MEVADRLQLARCKGFQRYVKGLPIRDKVIDPHIVCANKNIDDEFGWGDVKCLRRVFCSVQDVVLDEPRRLSADNIWKSVEGSASKPSEKQNITSVKTYTLLEQTAPPTA